MSDLQATSSTPAREADARALGLTPTRYAGAMVGGTLVVATCIAALLAVAGQPTWWRGFAAAGIATFASLVLSFSVVLPLFNRPISTLMFAFLAAGIVRTVLTGAIVVVAIRAGGYPENATLLISALLYATMIVLEGFTLWSTVHNDRKTPSLKTSPSTREIA